MRELPPTAGLPLKVVDLLPGGADFAAQATAWLGTPPLQLECSGTAALVVTLHAMRKLKPERREVVVPAWTCPLVALAIHRAGLIPRLCDLAPDHYDMDAGQLAAVTGSNTLAIVPTHIAGRIADIHTANAIARRAGAFVIEDAAQATGARQDGRSVGLLGDAGFFSLAVGKGLTLFEGGLLTARESIIRDALMASHNEIIHADPRMDRQRALELAGYALMYRPSLLSLVYGNPLRKALAANDPVVAVGDDFGPDIPLHTVSRWRQAVGARALPRLHGFVQATRKQALRRLDRLRRIPDVVAFDDAVGDEGVWPFLLLLMPSEKARDVALKELWTAGLGVSRLFIHALPDYGYLRDIVAPAALPRARDFAARSLTIGNSLWLRDDEFARICSALERAVTASRQ
jgi:dTDP-4-amino-4,6-dideoxygalactose transaminase